MSGPSKLKKITLHLARTQGFPEGSARHGYDILAPLTDDGRIDQDAWRDVRNACVVHRFWGSEPVQRGRLVHRAGGAGGGTWGFDYDVTTMADDEAGYRFGDHAFRPGEYVSIRDDEGEMHTFRVVSVDAT